MQQLLSPHEPHPLEAHNSAGTSDFVVICEHAGRLIPGALGDLGLDASELTRHIAWDIGAREIAMALADRLDAPLFMQRYSRLVCDCNRRPDVDSFMPVISESTEIPGNMNVSADARAARVTEIFNPFHDHVSAELDKRRAADRRTLLVTIHSFTPVYKGVERPWEIGVLYNRDKTLSPAMLELLRAKTDHVVGDNQPYAVGDETDYAIPVHGEARGLPCVEIEIRNDLTTGDAQAEYWSALLADMLTRAAKGL
ncbi:N-formylglutamate amidohydrolase [Paracoccus sp. SCSIO 75233]|uniref:N-formylglutamate amidohydrolase n=1 Tax=Paracoccus sp. SCSIO 75233 TaxID=3017782 RepID=UPI0022F03976|nr:N-formylglutamate amidohydrolase [Paracoccus sp. SCSIO 75233]WBU54138.1 N-formylglutamate amidohydrolase [Paracoccus sp. SCSIO 75233]